MFTALLLSLFLFQNPDDAFVGQKAPELKPQGAWINSAPLKLE